MIAPGGCGSTCSDELKREYEAMLCPAPPPPHHGPAPAPAHPPPHHGPAPAHPPPHHGPAMDLEGQSCHDMWTDCHGCYSTGAFCGTPLGAVGEPGGHAAVVYCGDAMCPMPPHHGPPPCAMTCPTHMPTCAEF